MRIIRRSFALSREVDSKWWLFCTWKERSVDDLIADFNAVSEERNKVVEDYTRLAKTLLRVNKVQNVLLNNISVFPNAASASIFQSSNVKSPRKKSRKVNLRYLCKTRRVQPPNEDVRSRTAPRVQFLTNDITCWKFIKLLVFFIDELYAYFLITVNISRTSFLRSRETMILYFYYKLIALSYLFIHLLSKVILYSFLKLLNSSFQMKCIQILPFLLLGF